MEVLVQGAGDVGGVFEGSAAVGADHRPGAVEEGRRVRVFEELDVAAVEFHEGVEAFEDLVGRGVEAQVAFEEADGALLEAIVVREVTVDVVDLKALFPIHRRDDRPWDTPEDSVGAVEIDADQVSQVLMNLMMNAVQAMPEGGRLTLSARSRDHFLEVAVSDTGGGIPKKDIGKIFEPLFTTRAKGIGLGLAVSKTIIGRHRGQIKVESEEGKGSTFRIELPFKAEPSKDNAGGNNG